LAREIDAVHVKNTWGRTGRVVASVPPWQVTLDIILSGNEDSSPMTRMRAPFLNPRRCRFHIYRKTIFSGLGKLMGMQDMC